MSNDSDIEKLRKEYEEIKPQAERFCSALEVQLKELLSQESLDLGAPIEYRVKEWEKIKEKIERKNLSSSRITDLNDLVGLRLIFLFNRDAKKACELIEREFDIIEREDKATQLNEEQFGYQSFHYVIKLPEKWQGVPTLRGFDDFKAEIQIRTLAQHIWAAASHTLQYKQEENIPSIVRRSINRVSALLEIVDLEFERALQKREGYIEQTEREIREGIEDFPTGNLNVDNTELLLRNILPKENWAGDEDYYELLKDLKRVGIIAAQDLVGLVIKHKDEAKKTDLAIVDSLMPESQSDKSSDKRSLALRSRLEKGVLADLTGLVRIMLPIEYGEDWYTKKFRTN